MKFENYTEPCLLISQGNEQKKKIKVKLLPNQIWVHSPIHSKANLLTPVCGDGKCSVYCKAMQGVWTANAQKTWTPWWFSGKGF